MNQKWTNEEIQFLKNNIKLSPKQLSIHLQKSISSIYHKKYKLGITRKTTCLTQKEAESKSLAVGIKMTGKYTNSYTKVEFECPYCNKIFLSRLGNIYNLNTKSCGCLKIANIKKTASNPDIRRRISEKNWRGTKDIGSGHFSKIKASARVRNLKFNITIEYIQKLLEKQNYECALTGIPIKIGRNHDRRHHTYAETTASLDRIDSKQGYISENVQWLHKDINNMKQGLSEEKFLELCKLVIKKSKNNKKISS